MADNADRVTLTTGRVRARQFDGQTWIYVGGFFTSDAVWSAVGREMKINLAKRTHSVVETHYIGQRYGSLLDERGNFVAMSIYDRERRQWQILAGAAGTLRPVLSGTGDVDLPFLEGLSPDQTQIWLKTWDNGVTRPAAISLADGKPVQPGPNFAGLHRNDWSGVVLDRLCDRVVAGVIQGDTTPTYEFVDTRLAQQWQRLVKSLDRAQPALISATDDKEKLILETEAPTGPRYLLAEMPQGSMTVLGPEYRQLPSVAEVRTIHYAASDGLDIPAYLTLPAGRAPKGLPLIVLPHGGPEARDYGGFDWWAQALAYEGYAVLQPNFRGSTTSDKFVNAGNGEWGRKMQTDLSDGVRYLAGQGLIDPARVCIVGASYGGYAALAGVTLQQGIYRCAVSVAGVSDLRRQITRSSTVRAEDNRKVRYFERWLGVSNWDDPSIDRRSPLHHVEELQVPLLLIHGRDDMVVQYEQSRWLADALERLHKPVRLVDLKSEDHWLSHAQTRQQMLAEVADFLKANNPPDTQATPAPH